VLLIVEYIGQKMHSKACRTVNTNYMESLDDLEQLYILLCPASDHDAVRLMFGYEAKLVNQDLVRKS
jgi:hypothetical protein